MTHRYFFTNHTPPFQPTLRGTWSTSTNVVYRELGARDGPITTVSQAETSSSTTWDMALLVLMVKFHYGGNIIAGTNLVDMRYGRLADTVSSFVAVNNAWISAGATSTLRNTLVTQGAGSTNWLTSPVFSFFTISPTTTVAVTAGDYLVIELGARGITSSTTSRTASLYYGGFGVPDPVTDAAVIAQAGYADFSLSVADLIEPLPISGTPMMMAA